MLPGTEDQLGNDTTTFLGHEETSILEEGPTKRRNVRPVSVKQALAFVPGKNPKDSYVLDNKEAHSVSLVASVVQASDDKSNMALYLQDGGVGYLRAYWKLSSSCLRARADELALEEGGYVQVIGRIVQPAAAREPNSSSNHKAQNYLSVAQIRRVTDSHEICFHILDVINHTFGKRNPSTKLENTVDENTIEELIASASRLKLSTNTPIQSGNSALAKNNASRLSDSPLMIDVPAVPEEHSKASSSSTCVAAAREQNENEAFEETSPKPSQPGQSTLVESTPAQALTSPPSPSRNSDPFSNMSNLERAIHLHLLNAKEQGKRECHIADITLGVKTFHRSAEAILDALNTLEDKGLIRSTDDELSFEPVDDEPSLYDTSDICPPGSFPAF